MLGDDVESMVDMVDCTENGHSPRIETLLAVERLYLFQPFVLRDVQVITRISLSLPIVDHLTDSCSC